MWWKRRSKTLKRDCGGGPARRRQFPSPKMDLGRDTALVKSAAALRLGPVARKLINPDSWAGGYPGPAAYVKELDTLLHSANQNDYLNRFVPNLEARDRQRDKALNELRTGGPPFDSHKMRVAHPERVA